MTIKHLYPTQRPALDLNFAQQKRLDRRVTFTRSTTGTYVDSNGVIKTAAANEARFDHDPESGSSLGLLIEESRTNSLTYSAEFDNAAWTKTTATVSPNATTSPDNTISSEKLIPDSGFTGRVSQSKSFTSGVTYSQSVFAKEGEFSTLKMASNAGIFPVEVTFDLSTGTISSLVRGSATITPVGNGWYRCTATATAVLTSSTEVRYFCGDVGDGTSGIYIWGAQLEQGSFPTSYIPTAGATLTRAVDIASMTGTNFSSWYNQSEGTVVATVFNFNSGGSNSIWSIDSGSSSNRWMFRVGSGVSVTNFDNVWDTANPYTATHACAVADNDIGYAKDGAPFTPGPTSTFLGGKTALNFGTGPGVGQATGHISRLAYYPTRLPDTQLQTLTL